jgi:hypothetical protein
MNNNFKDYPKCPKRQEEAPFHAFWGETFFPYSGLFALQIPT